MLARPLVVALPERLHRLLEELDGLRRAAVGDGRLLRVHRRLPGGGALPEGARTPKIARADGALKAARGAEGARGRPAARVAQRVSDPRRDELPGQPLARRDAAA